MTVPAELDAAVDTWVAAWNEADAGARAALLERSTAEDCVFSGPTGRVRGRAALHGAISEARDFMPGAVVVRTGPAAEHGGELRFGWEVLAPGGGRVLVGVDAVELDGSGRLASVVVLTDPPG